MALARLLQLDKPSPPLRGESLLRNNENALAIEHRKRLWWTCFLMDRMISAELGLTPTEATFPADIAPPSSKTIPPGDLDQFFDSDLFGLQIRICELKLRVARIESLLRETSEYHDSIAQSLKESLDSLQDFRESIPNYMSLEFSKESSAAIFNLPWARGIATLYLRYHQVKGPSPLPTPYRYQKSLLSTCSATQLFYGPFITII